MKAFVTGSTGLLGNNLTRLLVARGYEVKALTRSLEKANKIFPDLPVTFVLGDMQNIDGFAEELNGCDVLFHCAAYFMEYYQPGDRWPMLEAINIKGTVKLLEVAERQGIKKVIYVSSSGVIGKSPDGTPADETIPASGISHTNLYKLSKVLAEEAVYDFLKDSSLSVVFILPGWIFGPGDISPTSSGQLVLDLLGKKMRGIIPGGVNMVDARDVGQIMINAVEKGKSGDRYLAAGHHLSIKTVMETFNLVTGIPIPKRQIPYFLLRLSAFLRKNYARLTKNQMSIFLPGIETVRADITLSSEKAIRELDATFRPFEETMRDEVAWFRDNGYV
ncbi:MAG: SDR family oxidoreductase [Cyanobacteriota bacterium]|nr:SDR family oxidoreductase [Cyanobacteriota bacterium]